MSLRHAIYLVLLDGEWHPESEIIARVRHTIDPSKAVRMYAKRLDGGRVATTNGRVRVGPGKALLTTRKESAFEELNQINPDKAVAWLIRRTFSDLDKTEGLEKKEQYLQEMFRRLDTKVLIGKKQTCGKIAREFRNSLLLRGKSF